MKKYKKIDNKGKYCEEKALEFFKKRGWCLVARNKRLGGIEIDLILENSNQYLLVEVKSDNLWRKEYPIKETQKKRLIKAFSAFCEQQQKPVQIILAIVNKKVHLFDLEF